MDSYQYQSINLDRPSIRLLQLYKGHWSDKIHGHFISAWFDEPDSIIPYSALSYAWGYIDKVEEVIVDSTTIKVTFNLHMALQHLRSEKEDRILWIDALCINQDNVHEKIHQIRQMGDIYKKAEKVVVWLGRGTRETDLVMDAMKRLQKASLGWHSAEWRDKANDWIHENNEHQNDIGKQMRSMLERPWFRRIWILQEIANARRATTVHCGNRSISAMIFSQFPALINFHPSPHCQSVLDIMPGMSRHGSGWSQGQKLHTLLIKFRKSEATDDRDMIYALLGISSDAHRSKILDQNCDKSSQQVIREAVSFILSEKYPQLLDDASLYQFLDWKLTKFLDNVEDLEGAILMDAFKGAEEEFLKLLIETDMCRIRSRSFHDRIPLHWAVQREQQVIVQMLLDESMYSFRKKDSYEQTPLSLAIQTGNVKIVKLLLDKGANVKDEYSNGRTPLLLVIEKGKSNFVDLLVQKGVKFKAQDMGGSNTLSRKRDRSGQPTPSMLAQKDPISSSSAVENGNYDIAKLLLDRGARITDKDLSLAIEYGNDKMVELLVDYGADSGAKTSKRQKALLLAVQHGNLNLITSSIKRGIALDLEDSLGRTPLILAATYGQCKVIELLLESGAKLDVRGPYNQTPLIVATANNNKEAVELLLKKDADIEGKDNRGQTALLTAAKGADYNIFELLLQRGMDIEAKDNLGRTALSVAVLRRRTKIIRLLLDKGAELETRDQMGRTPLQYAMDSRWEVGPARKETIALLLEWGAINTNEDLKDK